jgi:hypothetical protein
VKKLSTILAMVAGALLAGCAVAERDISEIGGQFQDGIQGRGRIVEMDTTSDSFGPEYR